MFNRITVTGLALVFGLAFFSSSLVSAKSISSLHDTHGWSKVNMDLTGGLATTEGDYGGSFLLGVNVQVDQTVPVRVGLSSGIMFGSGTGLPILATALYQFGERSSCARPYLGVDVGPVIGLSGFGVFDGKGALGGDSVRLAILARPGIRFAVADALDFLAEVPFGGMTGLFYIAPTVGLAVQL